MGNGHDKERYIILRSARPHRTRDVFRASAPMPGTMEITSFDFAPADVSIEVDEIQRTKLPAITQSPDVVAVAPVIPMKLIEPFAQANTPMPAGPSISWGVEAVGAHKSPFSGAGIVVAVLDTGIEADHPAFAGVQLEQRDFSGDGNGDKNGHGTHCAGTIFGRAVGSARIGVAPGVSRALIGKVFGTKGGSSDSTVQAIEWAVDEGANVISMSLGIDFPAYVERLMNDQGMPFLPATSRGLEAYRATVLLFERLAAFIRSRSDSGRATILVAAAGNESRRDLVPPFEIGVSPPAVAEGVVSVGALGQTGQQLEAAFFSNTGVNVCGPGVDILSAGLNKGLSTMSGTSMATPHVAGVAALWADKLKQVGTLTGARLTTRLVGSARTTALASGFDPFDVGEGLVMAPES